ncbi:cation-translocating P-type ATPase [Methylococcus sp. EFPC2]|uniref:heavy metal translocating P-type ATPase n=1 Tax=Methylococcus sp. EFPC2 TaxID=2812648 RepID=UPI001967B608|nr:heavy metal translocating P-type ATPase [Methylococcus sp. EFPC2]QSA97647.1 copper-translocating P-type ATPase [Methylococcus sp. EFPC2]
MAQEAYVPRHCRVVHQTARRLRIVAPTLRKDAERSYIYEILLRKHPAIRQVRAVPELGSVAVYFDVGKTPRETVLRLLDTVLGNLGRQVASSPQVAAALDEHAPVRDYQLAIEGMTCASCALLIEMLLRRDPRVLEAEVNFATETLRVRARMDKDTLYARLQGMGYHPIALDSLAQRRLLIERENSRIAEAWRRFWCAGLFAVPSIALGMLAPHTPFLGLIQLGLSAPVVLWSGKPIFKKAWALARQRSANMDSLVALGVGSAFAYSLVALLIGRREYYFEAAAGIVTFVQMGRYLDEHARGQAHEAIRRLVDLQPDTATRLNNGVEEVVTIDEVQVGDILLVRPGERIPADGVVAVGHSTVDESMITGESMPVVKEPGHTVTGGCINGNGALQIQVKAVGADTVLSGIVRMVDQAQASKLPIQKLVDRVSGVFVPAVMGISVLTFAGWLAVGAAPATAFGYAITVLLIACPCALGLATPAAIMVGTGQAARSGIYIRNGESLEMASRLTAIVFDKTGTITEGKPRLTDLVNVTPLDDDRVLSLAASAEWHSEHFLAQAIVKAARERELILLEPTHFQSTPGRGITAQVDKRTVLIGNRLWLEENGIASLELEPAALNFAGHGKTPIYLAVDGAPAAVLGIADRPRDNARSAIERLHRRGVKTLMATGDISAAANHVAGLVGIAEVIAQARPEDKLEIIRRLQSQGEKVGMIGDGINDAPALAAADVSLAIGGGADVALQTADLTLVNGDIAKAAEAMALSKFTLRVIRQNLFWAFGYNTVAIPVAALGLLNPMIASAAMALSSVSVVLNSLRLQKT